MRKPKKGFWVFPVPNGGRGSLRQKRINAICDELRRQEEANKNPALQLPDPCAWMDERDGKSL